MPLKRGRGPEFFEEHGEVHPIRNSEGYDPDVERIRAEDRRRERSEEAHRHDTRERSDVERPPWGRSMPAARLAAIARSHGVSAHTPNWWEKVGLERGSGELREELREGAHRGDTRHAGERRGMRRGGHAVKRSRQEEAAIARRSALGVDLPF